jgi:hypothetical protein
MPDLAKRLLFRYGSAIALREWLSWERISPKVRVATVAAGGAIVAPFVVFVAPLARVYWLLTGKRLPRPLGFLGPPRYVFVNPFRVNTPPEIAELFERLEHNREPGPDDVPGWLDAWTRVVQVLSWAPPVGARTWRPRARK